MKAALESAGAVREVQGHDPQDRILFAGDGNDAKVAGVCSTIGKRIGIDPTFIRVAFVAVPL